MFTFMRKAPTVVVSAQAQEIWEDQVNPVYDLPRSAYQSYLETRRQWFRRKVIAWLSLIALAGAAFFTRGGAPGDFLQFVHRIFLFGMGGGVLALLIFRSRSARELGWMKRVYYDAMAEARVKATILFARASLPSASSHFYAVEGGCTQDQFCDVTRMAFLSPDRESAGRECAYFEAGDRLVLEYPDLGKVFDFCSVKYYQEDRDYSSRGTPTQTNRRYLYNGPLLRCHSEDLAGKKIPVFLFSTGGSYKIQTKGLRKFRVDDPILARKAVTLTQKTGREGFIGIDDEVEVGAIRLFNARIQQRLKEEMEKRSPKSLVYYYDANGSVFVSEDSCGTTTDYLGEGYPTPERVQMAIDHLREQMRRLEIFGLADRSLVANPANWD